MIDNTGGSRGIDLIRSLHARGAEVVFQVGAFSEVYGVESEGEILMPVGAGRGVRVLLSLFVCAVGGGLLFTGLRRRREGVVA